MIIAVDTNILLRFIETTAAQHPVVATALLNLRSEGHSLRIFPQAIYEFWVVATRPVASNGLALSPVDCSNTITGLMVAFPIIDDKSGLLTEWQQLVTTYACRGKVAHDARYVAAMKTHNITNILTFNGGDFARYPGIAVLNPNTIAASGNPPNR